MRDLYVITAVMVLVALVEVSVGTDFTAPHIAGRERRSTTSHCLTSQDIVTKAKICIEHIDDMKDIFVRDTLGYSWNRADSKYPLGEMQAPYLPQLPPAGTHSPGTFHDELVRHYGLLQHCLLAFEHLSLDQVLYPFANSHVTSVDNVDRQLNVFVSHLKSVIEAESLEPDHDLTTELGRITYSEVTHSLRRKRGFVILRDTRATLLHVVEVFETYCR